MYLETGRDLLRGILILLSAAILYWVNFTAGVAVVVFLGIMILLSVITDWCPADLILRLFGMKKKLENRG